MDKSITFCVAKSHAELAACRAILKTVFIEEEGFALNIPDRYEQHATYLYGKKGDQLVGCLRIVTATDQSGTPVESVVGAPKLNDIKHYGEISRFAILPAYRGSVLGAHAYNTCWNLCSQLGLEYVVAEARYEIRFLHKRLGFKEFGEPFYDPDLQTADAPLAAANAILMIARVRDLVHKKQSQSYSCPVSAAL